MAEPRKPIQGPGDKTPPQKVPPAKPPAANVPPAKAPPAKAPAPGAPPAKAPPAKAPAAKAPGVQAPAAGAPPAKAPTGQAPTGAPPGYKPLIEEPQVREKVPVENKWTKPPFLVLYGVLALLFLYIAYKVLFGSGGGPALTRVRGTVTLAGKPLPGAVVTFHPVAKEGRVAVGETDRMGHFGMKTAGLGSGVIPGEYRVTIAKMASDEKLMDPDEAKKFIGQTGKLPPEPKVTNVVPAKYAGVQTSGLSATVKSGGTMHLPPFDLK